MEIENCLQISYRGQIGCIFYFSYQRYEDIMQLAMNRFSIPAKHQPALLLSDELGHIFDKLSFEYYLTLFPEPEMVFYMRYDYNRALNLFLPQKLLAENTDTSSASTTPLATTTTTAQSSNKNSKRARDSDNEENGWTYRAVPVRRMNCFIGELPVSTSAQKLDSDYSRQVTKRMRLIDSKKRSRKSLAQPKHILRI